MKTKTTKMDFVNKGQLVFFICLALYLFVGVGVIFWFGIGYLLSTIRFITKENNVGGNENAKY